MIIAAEQSIGILPALAIAAVVYLFYRVKHARRARRERAALVGLARNVEGAFAESAKHRHPSGFHPRGFYDQDTR